MDGIGTNRTGTDIAPFRYHFAHRRTTMFMADFKPPASLRSWEKQVFKKIKT
jgi:hypothetical protein